jgi:hypothetical protein
MELMALRMEFFPPFRNFWEMPALPRRWKIPTRAANTAATVRGFMDAGTAGPSGCGRLSLP